jgi:hypothetical protein
MAADRIVMLQFNKSRFRFDSNNLNCSLGDDKKDPADDVTAQHIFLRF